MGVWAETCVWSDDIVLRVAGQLCKYEAIKPHASHSAEQAAVRHTRNPNRSGTEAAGSQVQGHTTRLPVSNRQRCIGMFMGVREQAETEGRYQ